MMQNVATSMSNAIRLSANDTVNGKKGAAPVMVNGAVSTNTTFIEVQWAWLSLPAIIVFFAAIILIVAIIMSSKRGGNHTAFGRQAPLWKGSNLGLLTHGLDWQEMARSQRSEKLGETQGEENVKVLESTRRTDDWAKGVEVQLKEDADGRLRFMLVED